MAWIETHQALVTHHKTSTLCGELGIKKPQAIGHLVMLWCWALDNAQDGNLTNISPKAIADAAGWGKKPEAFIHALRSSQFLCSVRCVHEVGDDVVMLHDWADYAGKLVEQRARNKDRMQCKRRGHVPCTCGARANTPPKHVQGYQEDQQDQPRGQDQEDQPPAVFRRVLRAVENAIGTLPVTIGQKLQAELREGTDPEWIIAAAEQSAQYNKRSWGYIETILSHWKQHGKDCECRKSDRTKSAHTSEEFREFAS